MSLYFQLPVGLQLAKQLKNGFQSVIKCPNYIVKSILTFKNGNNLWSFAKNENTKTNSAVYSIFSVIFPSD